MRLFEIGEAVKAIDDGVLAKAPTVPWREIARMRDVLAHHYFDTDHAIVQDVVDQHLGPLRSAVETLLADVKARGDEAVREMSIRFDKWDRTDYRLTDQEIRDCLAQLSARDIEDIKFAQAQVRNLLPAWWQTR